MQEQPEFVFGVVVLLYGIMGGLRAAYFTDLIQGICIIVLSVHGCRYIENIVALITIAGKRDYFST